MASCELRRYDGSRMSWFIALNLFLDSMPDDICFFSYISI